MKKMFVGVVWWWFNKLYRIRLFSFSFVRWNYKLFLTNHGISEAFNLFRSFMNDFMNSIYR